jgi:hypothetical protein
LRTIGISKLRNLHPRQNPRNSFKINRIFLHRIIAFLLTRV